MESVHLATENDIERCVALLKEGVHATSDQRGANELLELGPGYGPEVSAEAIAQWMQDSDRAVFVGAYETVVVGLCAGEIGQRDGTTGVFGTITVCYVQPEARGVGVGSALIGEVIAWFTKAGCLDVDARALPGDRAVKQLYEAHGFKARLITLHRQL